MSLGLGGHKHSIYNSLYVFKRVKEESSIFQGKATVAAEAPYNLR